MQKRGRKKGYILEMEWRAQPMKMPASIQNLLQLCQKTLMIIMSWGLWHSKITKYSPSGMSKIKSKIKEIAGSFEENVVNW